MEFNPLKKPFSLPSGEWRKWHESTRSKRPLAYFLFETLPDAADTLKRRARDVKYWVRHRTVDRYDRIYIRDLKPSYYDKDTQLLYGMFALLRDYVESECAHLTRISDHCEERYSEGHPKNCAECRSIKESVRKMSDAEAGLHRLDWEISLGEGAPYQAEAAKEIKALYLWWTKERPGRADPYEVHPMPRQGDIADVLEDILNDDREDRREWSDSIQKMEDAYEEEDTEMLIRLVKVRGSLWT